MSEKKEQIVPIRKPTRPSKPPTNKKPEVTQTCGGNNAMTMEEIKEFPPPATPAVQVLEQTYQEGEGWEPNEPTTIEELMGQIPDDVPMEVDTTCPFHYCLLEYRTSDNGFNYVKCPEYPCAFIASQQELNQYLQAVEKQRHPQLVINIDKMHSEWPKMLCYCDKPSTLKQSKSEKNPGRMYFSCRSRTCPYFQWLNTPWNHKILAFTLEKLNPPPQHPRYPNFKPRLVACQPKKKQNVVPFRYHPYKQKGRSFENTSQAPSAFQMASRMAQRLSNGCFSKTT